MITCNPVAPNGSVTTLLPNFSVDIQSDFGYIAASVAIEVRRVSDDFLMWSDTFSTSTMPWAYAGTTLVDTVQYKWRASASAFPSEGGDAQSSGWSSFVTFTPLINDPPTATLVSPIGGATVSTLTPTLTVNFSDPDTNSPANRFDAYQIQVRRVSDSAPFWDPGQVATNSSQQSARQAALVYAGTALSTNTAYEWRARVQDGGGLWSDYTAWQTFTPTVGPGAPTGLTPSGLTNTPTPTVSGAYVQDLGAAQAAFQYEIRQNTVTIYQSGDVATPIATGQAYGTNNPSDTPASPPALAWGTAYSIRARSKDTLGAYGPWTAWQAFTTNAAPTSPSNLSPSNAVVGDTTPTLSWQHNDPDGDAQTAVEIELYDLDAAAYVTGYNPKALTQATQSHAVTTTLNDNPTDHQWRVRTKGLAGPGFGPWSAWAPFTVAPVPDVVMTEPDPAEVIVTPGFTVTWTFSGGTGSQQDYRVLVYAADAVTVVYDSGVVAGSAVSHAVPSGFLRNNRTYHFRVLARDSLSQQGESSLAQVTTDFTPPALITGITATAIGSQGT